MSGLRFIPLEITLERTRRSRAAYYRDVNDGLWPKPLRMGPKSPGFLDHEIDTMLAARAAGLGDDEIRQLVKKIEADRAELFQRLTGAAA
jgi:prophage regulatory protein